LAEKEKLRKEKEAEKEKARMEKEAETERLRREWEAEQRNAEEAEARQWEAETKRQREEEKRHIEDQKREWAEQEQRWNQEEQARKREDAALQATMSKKIPPGKPRVPSSGVLRGQTLADYQKEQARLAKDAEVANDTPEKRRVRELEMQLEEARERERAYQAEREERLRKGGDVSRPTTAGSEVRTGERSRPQPPLPTAEEPERPPSAQESDVSWTGDEREFSRQQYQSGRRDDNSTPIGSTRPLPAQPPPSFQQRPLPSPAAVRTQAPSPFSRPLPTQPAEFQQRTPNRTDQYLAHNPVTQPSTPTISSSREAGDTALEQSQLHDARIASQRQTKAGGMASKSLLEREMERERERQREWEVEQKAGEGRTGDGGSQGPGWDVNQYGYTGGDSQNKGSGVGSGINFGGRRQIIGPRGPR
jgi:hypothetical protein